MENQQKNTIKKWFRIPTNKKKRKWAILGIIVLIIILIPFWILIFGGWLCWLIWKKVDNPKLKYGLIIPIALTTLFIGSAFAVSIFNPTKSENKDTNQSQPTQEATQTTTETKPAETTESTKTETPKAETPSNDLYSVISVTDGDTIKVDINGKTETIRLIGIDTPETVDPRKPVQCFGVEASNKAKELLNGKKVKLEADSTQGERDKYDRLLRYVFMEDGTFYNKYMIAEGFAHEYTYDSNPYKYQAEFKEAEKQAREQNKGFWNSNTCNGDTTKSADNQTTTTNNTTTNNSATNTGEPQVKKSTTGICHEKGSTYYIQTKNYTPYNSIDECLASGGRLPKK